MTYYIVKEGDTILDVSVNSTGSPLNIAAILNANAIDTWTPDLATGTKLIIPDNVQLQTNNLRELRQYPVNDSGFIPSELFDELTLALEKSVKEMYYDPIVADADTFIESSENEIIIWRKREFMN